jgi:hypothetical protein
MSLTRPRQTGCPTSGTAPAKHYTLEFLTITKFQPVEIVLKSFNFKTKTLIFAKYKIINLKFQLVENRG